MTNEEIKNLTREDILSDWLIQKIMAEDKATRGLTIARIADHAKAFGQKGTFENMIKWFQKDEKEFLKKQEEETKKLQAQKTDLVNTTRFIIPDSRPDLKNMSCGPWQAAESGIFREGRYFGEKMVACYQPVLPSCKYINMETRTERVRLSFKRNGKWKDITVDRSVVASASKIVSLADAGLTVTSETSKYLVQYLSQVEAMNEAIIPQRRSTSKLGWHKDVFLPYDQEIYFDGDTKFNAILEDLKPRGSREAWYSFVQNIRGGSRIEPKIALAASFASILVKICGGLPFFTHFHGQSEGGKSLCLMLAASVWGNPNIESAYVGTFSGSDVGFEVKADLLNNLPYFMDDTAQVKKKMARRGGFAPLIYTLCSGKGKDRSNKNLGLNRTNHWCTTFITNGEEPILEENAQGGAINRVLEIKCGVDRIFENGHEVAETLKGNYGFAGPEFVQIIKQLGEEKIKEIHKSVLEDLKQYGKMQKQSLALSILLTADVIAALYLFKDESVLPVEALAAMLKSEKEVSDNERCLNYIMDMVAANPYKFKTADSEPVQEWWGVKENKYIYIIRNVFDRICQEGGYSSKGFLEWANTKGFIETNAGRLTKRKRMGDTNPRCVCLNRESINLNATDVFEIDGFKAIDSEEKSPENGLNPQVEQVRYEMEK